MLNDLKKSLMLSLLQLGKFDKELGLETYARPAINNKTASSHARSSVQREPHYTANMYSF